MAQKKKSKKKKKLKGKLPPRERALYAFRFITHILAGCYGGFFFDHKKSSKKGKSEMPKFKESRRVIDGVIKLMDDYYRPKGGRESKNRAGMRTEFLSGIQEIIEEFFRA